MSVKDRIAAIAVAGLIGFTTVCLESAQSSIDVGATSSLNSEAATAVISKSVDVIHRARIALFGIKKYTERQDRLSPTNAKIIASINESTKPLLQIISFLFGPNSEKCTRLAVIFDSFSAQISWIPETDMPIPNSPVDKTMPTVVKCLEAAISYLSEACNQVNAVKTS
jgi:hypothetical protein